MQKWTQLKRCYIDNRFRTVGSISDSDSKFELQEQFDLPGKTACYVDDSSIPHTWRTIESHNNKSYIILKTEYINGDESITYNWIPYVLNIPDGNYSGSNLVTAIQDLLNALDGNFTFEVIYNPARGILKKNLKGCMLLMHSLYQVILG